MIPGLEMMACQDLAVPRQVMEHVVRVESSFNPYAIGVVGARLARQPRNLDEAVATAARLERDGYNFSLGLAQVNRHNLAAQGLADYAQAFDACRNLAAGARILASCHARSGGDWGKAFSCYYSGNFTRGFRDGYVEKVMRSMAAAGTDRPADTARPIPLAGHVNPGSRGAVHDLRARRSAPTAPPVVAGQVHDTSDRGDPALPERTSPANGPVQARESSDAPFVPRVTGPPLQPPAAPAVAGLRDAAFVF